MIDKIDKSEEKKIDNLLLKYGVNPKLKGYQYMKDIVILGYKKKYSRPILQSYFQEVADKNNIKVCSVQRQLRYAVSICNIYSNSVTPEEILRRANIELGR